MEHSMKMILSRALTTAFLLSTSVAYADSMPTIATGSVITTSNVPVIAAPPVTIDFATAPKPSFPVPDASAVAPNRAISAPDITKLLNQGAKIDYQKDLLVISSPNKIDLTNITINAPDKLIIISSDDIEMHDDPTIFTRLPKENRGCGACLTVTTSYQDQEITPQMITSVAIPNTALPIGAVEADLGALSPAAGGSSGDESVDYANAQLAKMGLGGY